MKIVIDWDLCEANGMCVEEAPELFHLDEDDRLHLLVAQPSELQRSSLELAERACPKGAISIEE